MLILQNFIKKKYGSVRRMIHHVISGPYIWLELKKNLQKLLPKMFDKLILLKCGTLCRKKIFVVGFWVGKLFHDTQLF